MNKSSPNKSNTALNFLTFAMLILTIAGIAFGIYAFVEHNGLFALASAISLSSLMLGCIRILK